MEDEGRSSAAAAMGKNYDKAAALSLSASEGSSSSYGPPFSPPPPQRAAAPTPWNTTPSTQQQLPDVTAMSPIRPPPDLGGAGCSGSIGSVGGVGWGSACSGSLGDPLSCPPPTTGGNGAAGDKRSRTGFFCPAGVTATAAAGKD